MFEQKDKEPILSEYMQNLVNRSTGEKIDSNMDEILRFKYKIMKMLVQNEDLINTLHMDGKSGDELRDVCIFDYMRLPDLKGEIKNYICFEVNDYGSASSSFVSKQITFRTVSHVSDIKTDWGVSRQDLLATIIKTSFDWSNALGLSLIKTQDVANLADGDYYYREIVYDVQSPNNIYDKVNGFKRH